MGTPFYNVVAVSLSTSRIRLLSKGLNKADAEAVVMMAVARRGVKEEFFAVVSTGTYKDGDKWRGNRLVTKGEG